MKKTLIQALFCLVTLMCGACTGQSKDDSGKDTPKEFIPTSWNGEFLKAISDNIFYKFLLYLLDIFLSLFHVRDF